MKYENLFKPIRLGNTLFRNRIFASPQGFYNVGADCFPNPETAAYYERKAIGGFASICVGDCIVDIPGMKTPIAPVSNVVDFTIAHLLEVETCHILMEKGIQPPVWMSANTAEGDAFNAENLAKYKNRIKML